jgi:DNA-binding transcriptional regulator YiaG
MVDKTLPTITMSAAEFKELRKSLDLTITHTALLLNMANARTIRRYEDAETEVSGPAGVLMRVMADVPGAFAYVDQLTKGRVADERE